MKGRISRWVPDRAHLTAAEGGRPEQIIYSPQFAKRSHSSALGIRVRGRESHVLELRLVIDTGMAASYIPPSSAPR
jgi:hypothetical protein